MVFCLFQVNLLGTCGIAIIFGADQATQLQQMVTWSLLSCDPE